MTNFGILLLSKGPFHLFNTLNLSQTTIFRLFRIKRDTDDNSKFYKNGKKFFRRVENTWKKENVTSNFSFPTVFSKDLYCRYVKTRACLGKVKYQVQTIFFGAVADIFID